MLHSVAVVTVALVAYACSPERLTASGDVAVRITVSLVLVVAAVLLATWSVWRSRFPALRALEAITSVVSITIVAFASVYVLASGNDPTAFSEPLDHTGALYFALTTATTVGFGDISPVSNPARIVVMIQMVVNVVVIGVAVRLLRGTAQRRRRLGPTDTAAAE